MKSLAHLAQQFSRPRVWLDVLLLAALYALASRWPVLKIVAIVASIDLLSFVLFHLFAQQRGMAIQGFLGGLVSSTATFVQLLNSERYKGQSTALLSRTLLYALCAMLLECMLILVTLAPTAPWHFYLPFAVSLSGFYGLTWLPQLTPNSNSRGTSLELAILEKSPIAWRSVLKFSLLIFVIITLLQFLANQLSFSSGFSTLLISLFEAHAILAATVNQWANSATTEVLPLFLLILLGNTLGKSYVVYKAQNLSNKKWLISALVIVYLASVVATLPPLLQ